MPRRPTTMMSPLERRLLLARTIYVDASATGTNDGTSWPTAYTDLQSALAIATSGDTIDVAQGTYKPTTSTDPTTEIQSSFDLVDGVTLLGGFAGNAGAKPDLRDPNAFPSTLSGEVSATPAGLDNSCHVLIAQDVGSGTVMDGFTIEGGSGSEDGVLITHGPGEDGQAGEGMFILDASPTIRGCVFTNNIGTNEDLGGGIAVWGASEPTINDCSFLGNTSAYGGGLYLTSSLPVNVDDCTFSGNASIGAGANGEGGAIYAEGNVNVTGCTFQSNTSYYGGAIAGSNWLGGSLNCAFSGNTSGYGGAVYLDLGCDSSFIDCMFSHNNANTTFSNGGAIYSKGFGGALFGNCKSVLVQNTTFSDDSAASGGAAYFTNTSSATLSDSIFTSDAATSGDGGALSIVDSTANVARCDFNNNSSSLLTSALGRGGAVYDYNSTDSIDHCVFDSNTAASGGGLYESTSTVSISDSLFDDNTADWILTYPVTSVGGRGGGIAAMDSNVSIVNTTIAFNHSNPPSAAGITHVVDPTGGGGIYISSGGSYAINGIDFSLRNSIIWGNTASRDPGIDAVSISPSFSNNDISGGTGGPAASNFNPRFVRNPSPGADGKWGTADDDLGDLHLQYNSPALGKGNPALLPASDTTDASGNPRLRSGQLDLGAYETGPADFAVSTLSLKPLRSPATPTNLSLSGTLSVLNDGSSVPSGKLTVELFLSSTTNVPTGTPAASPIATLLVSTAHLTPGTPFRLPFSLRLKGKTAAGTYYVVAEANPNNALPEATETNNTTASPALTL